MGTTARVASGSLTKGSSAEIIYPNEYSGSDSLRKYDQGVYANDMEVLFGTTIAKLRPNNDFHQIIDGKVWKGDLRAFDDQSAPTSFAFDPHQQRPVSQYKPFINGIPQAASSGSGTNAKPADADDGWNHHWWYMQKSQIAMSAGDGTRTYVSGARHVRSSGLTIAPSHFRLDYDLGMTDIFQDATPFKDTANNDPTNIVTTDPLVIDFPSNLVNQSDSNLMDGVLEPFPLRSVIDHSTLEVPFQSRGIRADMTLTDAFRRSTMMQYQVQSISSRTVTRDGKDFVKGCDPYLDGVEVFGLDLLDNFGHVTSSLRYAYGAAVSGTHPASDASGPVYKSWWDHHKVTDLYNLDENKRSGPLMQPGYLYKPAATIPPFRDGTDREDVTSKIKDETLTAGGKLGLLNFTFTNSFAKYSKPFVTSSFGLEDRPQDLVLHARLDKNGNFGENPSLVSNTAMPSTFIMYQTGALWSFSANNISTGDTPYITEFDGRSMIPTLSSNTIPSGSLSPSAIVITSSHYAGSTSGSLTYGVVSGTSEGKPTIYHSPFSPTVPGTRISYAGTGRNHESPSGGSRNYAQGSRFHSGSTGGYMGLQRPCPSGSAGEDHAAFELLLSESGRDTSAVSSRQSVAAGWANAPTRPWAFGVWMRGDGETNYRIGEKVWNHQSTGPDGPALSDYGDHAHIWIHSGYAQQRFQPPSHTLTSSVVTSGTMHPDYNFLGSPRHRQNQFLINHVKEYKYATVWILSFMHNSHGAVESWVGKSYYCSDSSNANAYAAITDGQWHHWAYAQHPNAGRNIYEHLTESAQNNTWRDTTDGSTTASSLWSNSTGQVSGSDSQTWNDANFNGFRAFCDGIELSNGYMTGWKSAKDTTGATTGDKRDGKLWRCPTPTSDNAYRTTGQNLDDAKLTKHQIDFVGALGHKADNASRRLFPMAEPVFFVTPVTSTSGSQNNFHSAYLTGSGPIGTRGSADVSGSLNPMTNPDAQGNEYPQTNGLPYTGWWIDNVWSGKVFRAITGISKIKSLSSVSGETMKNALHDMNVQVPGHYTLDRDCVSPGRGIVYDNTEYGMDSLCFGGLKK